MGDPVSAFIPNNSINCRAREFLSLTDTDQESLLEPMDLEQPQQAPSPGKGRDPGTKECGAAQRVSMPSRVALGLPTGYWGAQALCSRTGTTSAGWLFLCSIFFFPLPPSQASSLSLRKGHCTPWQGEKIANQRNFCFYSHFLQVLTRPLGFLWA